jgi:RNA polymerase sigma-70 factor, ECF subfamily
VADARRTPPEVGSGPDEAQSATEWADGIARALAPAAVIDVRARLLALLDAARASFPDFHVDGEAFLRHVAARVEGQSDLAGALDGIAGSDLYLAFACAQADAKAVAEFERRHVAEVPRALSRLGPTAEFADEVQQALRERLLVRQGDRPARIADYSGRGPLGAWVRVAAVRLALSLKRTRRQAPVLPGDVPELGAVLIDPEMDALRRRYRDVLKEAVQAALTSLREPERVLLRRHVLEGKTVEQLGAEHGVHASTISRRITRIRGTVLEHTQRILVGKVGLHQSELKSLLHVLRTDLDVSLERVLGVSA